MDGIQVGSRRRAIAALALAATVSLGVVACGGGDEDEAGRAGDNSGTTAGETGAPASKCGLGNGRKASGEPIELGAIVTKMPGTDFTAVTGMAQAYFDCVNDNGGIQGRTISYTVETEQTNPQQIASLATKLWENDGSSGSWATRACSTARSTGASTRSTTSTRSCSACRGSASSRRTWPA